MEAESIMNNRGFDEPFTKGSGFKFRPVHFYVFSKKMLNLSHFREIIEIEGFFGC